MESLIEASIIVNQAIIRMMIQNFKEFEELKASNKLYEEYLNRHIVSRWAVYSKNRNDGFTEPMPVNKKNIIRSDELFEKVSLRTIKYFQIKNRKDTDFRELLEDIFPSLKEIIEIKIIPIEDVNEKKKSSLFQKIFRRSA